MVWIPKADLQGKPGYNATGAAEDAAALAAFTRKASGDNVFAAALDDLYEKGQRSRNAPKSGRIRTATPERIISAFQPGHGWAKVSGPGAVADDAAVFSRGAQSLSITTTGTGTTNPTIVGITGLAAMDLTRYDLQISFRVNDWKRLARNAFRVRAGSDLTANHLDRPLGPLQTLDTFASGDMYALQGGSGKWQTYTATFATATGTGAPKSNAVTALGIYVADNGAPVQVNVQHIALVPKAKAAYPNGAVTFTFDDGYLNNLTTAAPIMDRHGFTGTVFTIADKVGTPNYLTHGDLRKLQDHHGWEVASHAMRGANHDRSGALTTITIEELDSDFSRQKEWMREHGYNGGDFSAYPQGLYNDQVVDVASRYFSSVRTTQDFDGLESIPPGDPMRVRCIPLADDLTLARAQTLVNAAHASGAWVIFYTHQITANPTGISATPEFFQQVVNYVASKGIPVRNYGDVMTNTVTAAPLPAAAVVPRPAGAIPPSDYGFRGWNMDPLQANVEITYPAAGSIFGARLYCTPGETIGGALFQITTAGAGCVGSYVAAFDSAGNRLSLSAEMSAQVMALSARRVALPAFVVPADGVVVLAFLIETATTLPKFSGAQGGGATSFAFPDNTRNARAWRSGSGMTAIPSTVNLRTVTQLNTVPFLGVGA